MSIRKLDQKVIRNAASELANRDPTLGKVLEELGPPPLWKRPATFATFVRIVLEQQVSLDSARMTYERLSKAVQGSVVPKAIAKLGESDLRSLGFTRQNARYVSTLARDVLAGDFRIGSLPRLDDQTVREKITARLGLGDWTADVYLMMALLRPDVVPLGDLALIKGCEELFGKEFDRDSLASLAETWRPYRSVATRMIWQSYLDRRGRKFKT
ncbi:MAG: DNA-3-methyladenine glycosylase 2 family protein [Planctomycetota bacterium]